MLYFTDLIGPDKDAFIRGLTKAVGLARESSINQVVFLAHTLGNLDGVPEDVLGEKVIKELKKSHLVMANEVSIHLETERIKAPSGKAIFFAPFVSLKFLDKMLGDYRVVDLVYVPWAEEERKGFLKRNSDSREV